MSARLVFFLLLCALPAWPQGFAGLGTSAGDFMEVTPGKEITFPKDYAAHPDYRIEWWYLTANLTAADGREFGVQWTLFRAAFTPSDQQSGWQNSNIWMGHAALTTASEHYFTEKFARGGVGQAGVTAEPFEAWIDDWSMATSPRLTTTLSASGAEFSYSLRLHRTALPVLHGDNGYNLKSTTGQASYYYSEPFLTVEGTIRNGSEDIPVTGTAWLDREWSSQPLDFKQIGWDWLALHLPDGEKLMIYSLRGTGDSSFRSGTWIAADGRSETISGDDITLEPLETTTVAERQIPTRWRLSIPARDLIVETTPLNPQSWMDTLYPYWEGPVSFSGSHSGRGYLEMTGY